MDKPITLLGRIATLGPYDLRADGGVFRELSAMLAALELFAQNHCDPRAGVLPDAMGRERLLRAARFLGLEVPADVTDETLRDAVALRLRLPWPRTPAEIKAFLAQLGAAVALIEQPERKRVIVEGTLGGFLPTPAALERLLALLLPAGIGCVFSLGALDWALIDQSGVAFDMLDAENFNWTWFDLFGHRLFV